MVRVETTIHIERPLDVVASYAGNPENAPIWYDNIDRATWIEGSEVALGAKIAFHATFLGKELSYTYEIVELTPGVKLKMTTAEGPFPMTTTYV